MIFCPCCNIGIDYKQMIARHCNNCSHEWKTYHVLPVGDLKKHTESYTCECKPIVEHEGGNIIVIHNSFDGREGVEWANEILEK